MGFFGWIGDEGEPPATWDLRLAGWTLCRGARSCRAECRHVLVCDTRRLAPAERVALAEADWPAWRLILLGVEQPAERAALLTKGFAEALPVAVGLSELAARTRRINSMFGMLPRWRTVGALTLDLFHRDARRGSRWLGLHPREFGLLWRLADNPGKRVTRRQLLKDVWRLNHEPETNSLEVHVSRLRAKLADAGCERLVETLARGGYRLAEEHPLTFPAEPTQADAIDNHLRELGWAREPSR